MSLLCVLVCKTSLSIVCLYGDDCLRKTADLLVVVDSSVVLSTKFPSFITNQVLPAYLRGVQVPLINLLWEVLPPSLLSCIPWYQVMRVNSWNCDIWKCPSLESAGVGCISYRREAALCASRQGWHCTCAGGVTADCPSDTLEFLFLQMLLVGNSIMWRFSVIRGCSMITNKAE